MFAVTPEYTRPLLDDQEDQFEKEANISAHDSNDTTAGRSAASIGVATKKVSAIILATVVLTLINAMCIVLVTYKTDAVFKALQTRSFVDTRSLPRPDQYGL
jgi:hypothetical protein